MRPRGTRALGLVATTILGLVLAACGGATAATLEPAGPGGPSADGTESPSGGDAAGGQGLCKLVPADRAADVLGEAVDEGKAGKTSLTGTYYCRYTALGSGDVLDLQYSEATRAEWEEDMATSGMDDETPLEGVGEVAYRSGGTGLSSGVRLAAWQDGSAVWVVVTSDADPAALFADAESLAKGILAKLAG